MYYIIEYTYSSNAGKTNSRGYFITVSYWQGEYNNPAFIRFSDFSYMLVCHWIINKSHEMASSVNLLSKLRYIYPFLWLTLSVEAQ